MKKLIFLSNLILINFYVNAQQYLNKDFNDLSLTSGGWTTQIITGTTDWFANSFNGDNFVKISNYNNNQNSSANTWLISNSVDLSSASTPFLSFETIMKFPGDALVLHVSTDYDGTSNPNSQGTWTDITSLATWDVDNTAWGSWTPSGGVDLTSYISATTYIAFEYTGSNTNGSTWEIDNIQINEGASPPPPTGLDTVSIYDIQYTTNSNGNSIYDGLEVYTGGIVTAVRSDSRFYLSSGSGPWSGIYVFSDLYTVNIGDSISFKGEVVEFFDLTEIKNITNFQNISSSNSVVANICSSASANSEAFEGCLVKVLGAVCNDPNSGFGEWVINDGSGDINVDDLLYDYPNPNLNTVYDVVGVIDFNFGNFKLLPRNASDINISNQPPPPPTGLDTVSIYNIQYTPNSNGSSNYEGNQVYTGGIVTALRSDSTFYLSSGSGPWSGIYVFSNLFNLNVGDSVTLNAEVVEYFELTELKNITNLQVISSGNLTNANSCNTAAVSTEEFEGCLVKVSNAICNNTNAGFGEWVINDGSGDINVDDLLYDYPNPTMNSVYDVTGIVDFSFSEFKLLPRSSSDVSQSVSIDENSITNFDFYPNPLNSDNLNVEVDKNSSILLYDYSGKIIRSFSLKPGINNLNLSNISKGLYLIKYGSETYMFSKI
jgi:predicted extracellular nuclease